MATEQCLPCRDICDCMTFTSTEGTILVERTNCAITLDINPDSLVFTGDTSVTTIDPGVGISVGDVITDGNHNYSISNTGVLSVNGLTGNVTIDPADGTETIVTAGSGATVTGDGSAGDPYVVSCTCSGGDPADGTETIVTAGDGISVTGLGSSASPYIVINDGVWSVNGNTGDVIIPTYDGSETIVMAGINTTVTGTGTVIDPYIVNAISGSTALSACDFAYPGGQGFSTPVGGNYVGAQFVYKANSFAKWRGNMQWVVASTVPTTYQLFATTTPIGSGTCPSCGPSGYAYPSGQTRREFFVQGTDSTDTVFTFKVYGDTTGHFYIRALGSAYPAETYLINLEPIHFEIT